MFSDKYGLTEAVLSGRKTQTRRIAPNGTPLGNWSETVKKSRFQVGEVVAVAQSYCDIDKFYQIAYNRMYSVHGTTLTPYDGVSKKEIHDWLRLRKELKDSAGWTNKMFVRADLCPHKICFKDLWIERLQDISDEDCIKEGIGISSTDNRIGTPIGIPFNYFVGEDKKGCRYSTPREAYAALIDKISGKGTWESNPYTFAYEFELIK